MSDYARYKVIRYPIFHGNDYEDEYDKLDKVVSEIKKSNIQGYANFEATLCIDYKTDIPYLFLDYVLLHSYDDESCDYGKTRRLSPTEQIKYEKLFSEALQGKDYIVVDKDKLRLVDYCYYDCCEPEMYYDETTDPFYEEV